MNPDFQQAIDMTRSGDKTGAQKKVTAILKEDPDNAHAWYLLSLLVDSDQKRAVYLSKVVDLDPNHEKALEQLALLEATAPPKSTAVINKDEDLFYQADAGTVPDWMDGFGTAVTDTAVIEDEEESDEADSVPDWVQEDLSQSWVAEENSIAAPAKSAPPPAKTKTTTKKAPPAKAGKKAPAKKKPASKKKQAQQLNLILVGLVIVTILVALVLISMLL
jgi:hypothetical protein